MKNNFKAGFIGLIGPTNSGKSTLLNALIQENLSIVSSKPQTTYHRIKGIRNTAQAQLIFIDTPGFQSFPHRIPRMLNQIATDGAIGSDVLLWVFDVSNPKWKLHLERLEKKLKPLLEKEIHICVLNKMDLIPKMQVLPEIQALAERNFFKEIVPISAKKQIGTESLIKVLTGYLPEQEPPFDTDSITDRPESFFVTEYVREQIYSALHEELPYSTFLELEKWEAHPNPEKKCPSLYVTIYTDTDSRKKILVGRNGEQLKHIGMRARKKIEGFLGHSICLKLFVKVKPNWQQDSQFIKSLFEEETQHV